MTISVKLIFKLQHCDVEFENTATVGTVLAHACDTFRQDETQTVILSKGRELEHDVQLNTLSTSPTRPLKLMVVHKPSKSYSSSNTGFMRVAAIANICAELRKHEDAVRFSTPIAECVQREHLTIVTNMTHFCSVHTTRCSKNATAVRKARHANGNSPV